MTVKRLSTADAMWLALESPDMPMHVGVLLQFTPPEGAAPDFLRDKLDGDRRRDYVCPAPWNLVVVQAPIVGALPLVRETSGIDLEYHVRRWGLPAPGSERELGILVSRLHTQHLDRRRPLWEMHIIEGLENNRFALFFKLHHSVIDGVSAMRLISTALTTDPADRDTPYLFEVGCGASNPDQKSRSFDPIDAVLDLARGGVSAIMGLTKAAAQMVGRGGQYGPLPIPSRQPKTLLDSRIAPRRRLATQQYDLAVIKRLAKAADTTINDIVLYLSSTALRTYLAEFSEIPDRSLVAGVPISLRDQDDDRAGTLAATMFANLGTHIADPRERLEAIKASTAAAKGHLAGLEPEAVMNYTLALVAPWFTSLLSPVGGLLPAPQSVGISNVPGPPEPLYWNGSRLDAIYPMSLVFHGNALNITCISYAGTLGFGFTGARESLPHMQRLATAMGEALDELSLLLLP